MSFLLHYASFLLNTLTLVIAILVVLAAIFSMASRNKGASKNKINVTKLNDRFQKMRELMHHEILSKKEMKALHKQEKKAQKTEEQKNKKVFVLQFKGDIKASQVDSFRDEITMILTVATANDEVVVCLESPGGVVHGYGLAASQLQRIRERNIPLTVAVDKVAASGGYMMACVADKIIAAPFAIIGSIGVVMQMPNFSKLLEKNHIDYEMLTAGEYKRTLTMFGKNTEKGREKMLSELEETQTLFKDFIVKNRPIVNIDEVATGEHWFATQALKFNLVDNIETSDDYLLKISDTAQVFAVKKSSKKTFVQKLGKTAHKTYDAVLSKAWQEKQENTYF